ncbi:MAG: HD domain-containing protein [Planctomycetaceae bacterium]|nr:HD domain-containing protein [Planctomycetaceae bacterium]
MTTATTPASSMRLLEPVPARDIAAIITKTLNLVDARLMNHGLRVAATVDRALSLLGGYTLRQRRDIAFLVLVHDVGAYKTEEIDRIVHFETEHVWEHSVYGYLYLKHLTPLAALAPAVMFHHATVEEMRHLHPSYHELAGLLHIADRCDVLTHTSGDLGRDLFLRHFTRHRGSRYRADLVDVVDAALFGCGDCQPLDALIGAVAFSREEQRAHLQSLPTAIDFRSPQTVTHSLGVAHIAQELAGLARLPESAAGRIRLGALLHDLGKQGIPTDIIESPDRLDSREMAIMRTHVRLTEDILAGHADDDVVQIAVRHHEKLNGSGYHRGLAAADLALPERLVAVADIMSALMGARSYKDSFPKDKVSAILEAMVARDEIDAGLVDLALTNYDRIADVMHGVCGETVATYAALTGEYESLLATTAGFGRGSEWMLADELRWLDADCAVKGSE